METKAAGDEIDPEMVDRVAKAIFQTQVNFARAEINRFVFDMSDLPNVFRRLKAESETAQILVFGSYLEDRITDILRRKMRHLETKEAENQLFGPTGPLATFSGRISICFQLDWISEDTKKKLDAFRAIRNEFAHRAFKAKFSDPKIRKNFAIIDYKPERMLEIVREALTAHEQRILISADELTGAKRDLCNLAYLAEHVFRELIVRPFAIAHRLPEKALWSGDYEQRPSLIQSLYKFLSGAVLAIVSNDVTILDSPGSL